jgi:hypothetical protein
MSKPSRKRQKADCCGSRSSKNSKLYKTEPCDKGWNNPGACPYGKRCRYAHQPEELRPRRRCRHWKTKVCRAYARDGCCSYGHRCRFIHEDAPVENLPRIPIDAAVSKFEAETVIRAWTAHVLRQSPPPVVQVSQSRLRNEWMA